MNSPSRAPAKPVIAGPLARLKTAREAAQRPGGKRALRKWGIRLVALVVVLYALRLLFGVTVRVLTTDMWFNSVHQGSVYLTTLRAQILLFCVFGAIAALISGSTMWAVCRIRSPLFVSQEDDTFRWLFRRYEIRVRKLLILLAAVIPGIRIGQQAAGGWQTYLLWRHATPWHSSDPLFHKDISFFVDVYPFHSMIASLLSQSLNYALWIAVVGGYWYGSWRIRGGRRKVTTEFVRLMSLLLAGYLALKAVNYWLSRYALTTSSRGPVTGASDTDVHAALPGTYVLMSVAILAALALLANAVLVGHGRGFGGGRGSFAKPGPFGRVRVVVAALAVMVLASAVVGTAWPALAFHFHEAPSASKVDLAEIAHNQKATLAAYGLDGAMTTIPYDPPATSAADTVTLAGTTAQTSLIDPNELSPTFNVEQQLQAYYGFKSTLDTDHYELNGRSQDVAIAVRELHASGIPKKSWVNSHLVYTHGYGVVAAPTTEVDPKTESPKFLNAGIPPKQDIPVSRPQVYYGPAFGSSAYSIVGQPAGSTQQLEFDHPAGKGSATAAHTTYQGGGGIPLGSAVRRALFAVQLGSPNIFFSSELNSASQLLTVRDPAARVAKVAPWLTLDGNEYPVVVDGKIQWIVDAYTTTTNYPYSQTVNLHTASKTTLTANGASNAQPNTSVNYLQNSVKAVVDAYSGKVTLYSWNQNAHPDPLLRTWESAFPGLVKSQSAIPPALLAKMRYPTDLFNVQRYLLARYHVKQPANFYSGNNNWTVPSDPTVAASNSINASSQQVASPPLPSKYISMSADGFGAQHYSLSSPMVTLNGQQLAAFVYVNSEPGPDYGKFTVLDFPSSAGGESPAQVQNDIESNTTITEALTLQRGGNSKVVLGDLEAIPVAGRMLYVEPVYTQSSGGASFPILRHVIALYGTGDPSFDTDLATAIKDAIQSGHGTG